MNINEVDESNYTDQQYISISYSGKVNSNYSNNTLLYRILFIADDKNFYMIDVGENQKISAPSIAPIKEGYTFKWWKFNDEPFDFDTVITEDITLVAEFEKAEEYEYNEELFFVVGEAAVFEEISPSFSTIGSHIAEVYVDDEVYSVTSEWKQFSEDGTTCYCLIDRNEFITVLYYPNGYIQHGADYPCYLKIIFANNTINGTYRVTIKEIETSPKETIFTESLTFHALIPNTVYIAATSTDILSNLDLSKDYDINIDGISFENGVGWYDPFIFDNSTTYFELGFNTTFEIDKDIIKLDKIQSDSAIESIFFTPSATDEAVELLTIPEGSKAAFVVRTSSEVVNFSEGVHNVTITESDTLKSYEYRRNLKFNSHVGTDIQEPIPHIPLTGNHKLTIRDYNHTYIVTGPFVDISEGDITQYTIIDENNLIDFVYIPDGYGEREYITYLSFTAKDGGLKSGVREITFEAIDEE